MNVRAVVERAVPRAIVLWLGPASRAPLDVFTRAFSLSFLLYLVGWSLYAREWLTSYGHHVTKETIGRAYPSPAPLVPDGWQGLAVVVFFAAALGATLFPRSIVALAGALAVAVYIQLVDQTAAFTLNKIFIVGYAVALAGCFASSMSKDAASPLARVSAWPIRTLQATILLQYGTAGTCKIFFGDWLRRSDILLTHSVGLYRTEIAGFVIAHAPAFAWTLLGIGALGFELFAPVVFVWRKTRLFAALFGVAFHLSIAVLMKDLIYFSAQMITFYLLFLDEDRAERVEQKTRGVLAAIVHSLFGRRSTGTPSGSGT